MVTLAQFVVAAAAAVYLASWRIALEHRNHRSWDMLVEGVLDGTPRAELRANRSLRAIWALQKRAGIMAEIADYADRNGCTDQATISSIRSNSLAIRFSVWKQWLTRAEG